MSALTSISSEEKRKSCLADVLPELISAETVIVPTSLSALWVVM